MLGPRHTIESVTRELIGGLAEGTVRLHPAEPTEAEVQDFETEIGSALKKFRRHQILWLTLGLLASIMAGAALSEALMRAHSRGEATAPQATLAVGAIGGLIGTIAGYAFGYRTGERMEELKTYMRVLRMADAATARRLVLRMRSGLREKELVP